MLKAAHDVLAGKKPYAFETGNCIDIMRQLPDQCINVGITSPPYVGLRQYSEDDDPGEVGKERAVDCRGWATGDSCGECYICRLVAVFDEVWRILRDDGTLWVNIADSMNGFPGNAHSAGENSIARRSQNARQKKPSGYGLADPQHKQLDMLGAPWSLAFALRARGWFLRADVIWAKIAVMPSSTNGWRWEQHSNRVDGVRIPCPGCEKCLPNKGLVLRRGSWKPTPSHEYIFQFAKKEQYFTDPLAVRQLPAKASLDRIRQPNFWVQEGGPKAARNFDAKTDRSVRNGLENFARNPGRNLWDVWVIPPTSLSEEHYAAYPSGLPELAIRSSISQGGYCSECGAPFARIVEMDVDDQDNDDWETESKWADDKDAASHRVTSGAAKLRKQGRNHDNPFPVKRTLGWKATCGCEAPAKKGIVIDPFSGSGTTIRVANALGVNGIGCDLNPEYNALAERMMGEPRLIMKETHDESTPEQFSLF